MLRRRTVYFLMIEKEKLNENRMAMQYFVEDTLSALNEHTFRYFQHATENCRRCCEIEPFANLR